MMLCHKREHQNFFCEFYAEGEGRKLADYLQKRFDTPIIYNKIGSIEYISIIIDGWVLDAFPNKWIVFDGDRFMVLEDSYFHHAYEIVDPE